MAEPAPGRLAENILYFARSLRDAGLPVGSGAALDAIAAVEAAGIGSRADFHATLHAVLVKKREHSILFDQAFRLFWRRKGFVEKMVAALAPKAPAERDKPPKSPPGAARVADAFFRDKPETPAPPPAVERDARFTTSAVEALRDKDFAQMSAAEIEAARRAIALLAMAADRRPTRRFVADSGGRRSSRSATFRAR